jgi:hypothetical protein
LLAGCESTAWNSRYGPNPQISAAQVQQSLNAQSEFMSAFASLAGASAFPYYETSLAGFNYVDEVCDQYLVALFKIDRRRYLASRGISLAGAASATILGAYRANPEDISAVAAAFGFGSSFADAVGQKYLFSDKPELIYGTVLKLRQEKRRLAREHRDQIDSEPAAYAEIRGYLALCLPPVIDAYITKVIAEAEARPAGVTRTEVRELGSTTDVQLQ